MTLFYRVALFSNQNCYHRIFFGVSLWGISLWGKANSFKRSLQVGVSIASRSIQFFKKFTSPIYQVIISWNATCIPQRLNTPVLLGWRDGFFGIYQKPPWNWYSNDFFWSLKTTPFLKEIVADFFSLGWETPTQNPPRLVTKNPKNHLQLPSEQCSRAPGWLFYIEDEKLPSYIGIIS